jgi:hypothetical protein
MTPREAYNVLIIGFLFISINLEVNGYGILLPTSLGYGMIWLGCRELRHMQRSFAWASFVALPLAVLTLPLLVRGYLSEETFNLIYNNTFWPMIALELGLIALFTIAVCQESTVQKVPSVKPVAMLAVPITIAAYITWWLLPVEKNSMLLLSFLIYRVPTFYLAFVSRIAAVCLTQTDQSESVG